ncbi:MAG: molybdopterin cofactor-binding domain-containing protein [Bacteroidota bacterium]
MSQPDSSAFSGFRRTEDRRLLSGRATYVADINLPNQCFAYFVRSTSAHASLRDVSVEKALENPGVLAAYSGRDLATALPPIAENKADGGVFEAALLSKLGADSFVRREDRRVLATETVRYVGEAVAVVVADDPYLAEDAAELVNVDLSEFDAVTSAEEALRLDGPRLYESWPDNRALHLSVSKGDVNAAFASAAHRTRRRLHSGRLAASPLETRGVVAYFDSSTGLLTVWSSTQVPHMVRDAIAEMLQFPVENVRVIAPDVGGGFGVKAIPYAEEFVIAHLAVVMGRPVKWIEDRLEHFLASTHSRDQQHDIEIAFDAEGRILALRDHFVVDNGAANPLGVVQPYNTIAHLMGCYRVPNLEVEATAVVTNKVPLCVYRGAGRPEAVFAMERILDIAAREAGFDPVEIRRRNLIGREEMPYEVGILYRDGEEIVYDGGDFRGCFERAVDWLDARTSSDERTFDGRYVGSGLATYVEGTGIGPFEGAVLRIVDDGVLQIATGACSQGQSHETVFAHLAADEIGLERTRVNLVGGDTQAIPRGWGTIASRTAVVAGSAIAEAAGQVRSKILRAAGELLEIAPSDLEIEGGVVRVKGTPARTISLTDLIREIRTKHPELPPNEPVFEAIDYFEPRTVTFAYGVHAVRVAVDGDTGAVEILDYGVVHDCGRILHPQVVDGQICGGVAQGIGAALFEGLVYDETGQLLNPNFIDYVLPTAVEIPRLWLDHIEMSSPTNPLGVKGVGEAGAVAPPAAIANAVEDALHTFGVEITSVPLTPSYILRKLAIP